MSCIKCDTATLPCEDCQTKINCQKCNTPNAGICYWWCEEMKDKIHPKLLAEYQENKRQMDFDRTLLGKLNKLFIRVKGKLGL